MTTLTYLKQALRQVAQETAPQLSGSAQPLSDTDYSTGFDILLRGPGQNTYQDFIVPKLCDLLTPLCASRPSISILEIGPGTSSVLARLPEYMRSKVTRYTAFEPNAGSAAKLRESLEGSGRWLPCLRQLPAIHQMKFGLRDYQSSGMASLPEEKYDFVLICHSLYGILRKKKVVEEALYMLAEKSEGGIVAVFHRDGVDLDGLACHRTASLPTGVVQVEDTDEILDSFSTFIAGTSFKDGREGNLVRAAWRKECRRLGHHENAHPNHLVFSSPEIMLAFNKGATALPELKNEGVTLLSLKQFCGSRKIKNQEALERHPTAVAKPNCIRHVQECVRWALKHRLGLTVMGGSHSGQCLQPNVVAIDMSHFNRTHLIKPEENAQLSSVELPAAPFIVAETGCTAGVIVERTMKHGLTVPLGARPSVGAGLWLQGGIGHLARQYGLTCDAIVGAVLVSVQTGDILRVGHVPDEHCPKDAVRPEQDEELLWALKGAGSNFGIVIKVVFRAFPASKFLVRNWFRPVRDDEEVGNKVDLVGNTASKGGNQASSADLYLFHDGNQLQLGVTLFNNFPSDRATPASDEIPIRFKSWGSPKTSKFVDGMQLFGTELYMSDMHGGHGGGKTSAFKRCIFLNDINRPHVSKLLQSAIQSRPSPLCYLHLLHGSGAVSNIAPSATAFGCREWDYACVITGVWPRDQDGSLKAREVVQWVYDVASLLLPVGSGAYGADLGPDPRDAVLAAKAFGPNQTRLAVLKRTYDPYNVLAYACPLPRAPMAPKLIILVTGESCAGKDYCANLWAALLNQRLSASVKARAISISAETKRVYAEATGADLDLLLNHRAYKEEHRARLTAFFQDQIRARPWLPEEHFLKITDDTAKEGFDVLFITGMRDEAPLAKFSHLVPESTLVEVRVEADETTRLTRKGGTGIKEVSETTARNAHRKADGGGEPTSSIQAENTYKAEPTLTTLPYAPTFIYQNSTPGTHHATAFLENHILPLHTLSLDQLSRLIPEIHNFPRPGVSFRHVLNITQQPNGLALCTSLLQNYFPDESDVKAVVSCEAGGFVFASALAASVKVPMVLVRQEGKLPPPTVSVVKPCSNISAMEGESGDEKGEKRIEMEEGLTWKEGKIVVVDDVLASGRTLCAVLELLRKAGVNAERIHVLVVAEFPEHRGREMLYRNGWGGVCVHSLLTFGGL